VADGHGVRAAGVLHLGAADDAVRRLEGDGADHVVADVLGDLEVDPVGGLVGGERDLGGQEVVLVGHGVDAELDVDDRAGDAGDAPDPTRGGGVLFGDGGSHGSLSTFSLGLGQGAGAAGDLGDLLGDLGLTGLVGQPGVLLDEVL